MLEGVKSDIIYKATYNGNCEIRTTYLGISRMRRQHKLGADHKKPITKDCNIHGKLLDDTNCMILPIIRACKLYMSKTFCPNCPSLHSLPKFVLGTNNIYVGNGQYAGALFVFVFNLTLSITASLSLYDQYGFKSACNSSLVLGQPANIRLFKYCKWSSCVDSCCICDMDTHARMSVAILMALTLMSISLMGLSLTLTWLCQDSQSAIKILGPDLYIIWNLY